jgi:hypothetical protein
MTGRSQGGMGRTRLASGENAAAYDRLMSAPVALQVAASPASPAPVLRPWRMEDVAALVELSQDPALRQWATSVVDNDAHGARWMQAQQGGWAVGDRFGFAVLETQPVQFANSWGQRGPQERRIRLALYPAPPVRLPGPYPVLDSHSRSNATKWAGHSPAARAAPAPGRPARHPGRDHGSGTREGVQLTIDTQTDTYEQAIAAVQAAYGLNLAFVASSWPPTPLRRCPGRPRRA